MILLTRFLDLTINESHDSCPGIFLTTFYSFSTVISHTALKKLAFFQKPFLEVVEVNIAIRDQPSKEIRFKLQVKNALLIYCNLRF